jgi:hypothetical protein
VADIVNLRQARKRAGRALREEEAARNRAVHGRPKAERVADEKRRDQETARLDAHRRDRAGRDP